MTLKPDAVLTPTELPCHKCGQPIGAFYSVMLCDTCLDDAIPERPCEVCGAMDKHHPNYSSRGGTKRYWCEAHSPW